MELSETASSQLLKENRKESSTVKNKIPFFIFVPINIKNVTKPKTEFNNFQDLNDSYIIKKPANFSAGFSGNEITFYISVLVYLYCTINILIKVFLV